MAMSIRNQVGIVSNHFEVQSDCIVVGFSLPIPCGAGS